ncbi:MAG: DUF3332 family protein [Candidatus Omnitrophica bacterium]|nr:DUF3332 family protein [Candidatus Omnitrophota bacterium]
MKKAFTLLLILTVASSIGCTGSFNLTKKVYDAHRSQSDKWVDELFFLGCVLLPIYGISTFADAVIFNSIEFWTGENPVALNTNGEKKFVNNKGEEVTVSYNAETDMITVQSGDAQKIVLERTDGAVLAKNEAGDILYSSVSKGNGGVVVYNNQMQVAQNFSAKDVENSKIRN